MDQTSQHGSQETPTSGNGASSLHDLFALTDEQILEIEPAGGVAPQDRAEAPTGPPAIANEGAAATGDPKGAPAGRKSSVQGNLGDGEEKSAQAGAPVTPEPPKWLAERMGDPWNGEEAREFWDGVQREKKEAAAFREVFAKPEEARAAADRARTLDEIDRAYFGAQGKPAEEVSASRARLAQRMMSEDPAAFREMVFAGLRALEEAGKQPALQSVAPPFRAASAAPNAQADGKATGLRPDTTQARDDTQAREQNGRLAAYVAFEKAANEDLERSVGGAIERTLEQALPQTGKEGGEALKGRLSAAVRQEIEKSLQGDRQLGEQVAQVLAARRFDDGTRAQVVRLIQERAQQLVPSMAKRVLNEWTQTTLAAHRAGARQNETAAARSDLAPANTPATIPPLRSGNTSRTSGRNDSSAERTRRIDYRKLSDEQILEM